MQVPVWEQERNCGSLWAEQRGLYTIFRGEVETDRVSRLYAVFESGETALGIPVPECGKMVLRISVPTSRLPQGKLLRGSLRAKDEMWCRFPGGRFAERFCRRGNGWATDTVFCGARGNGWPAKC